MLDRKAFEWPWQDGNDALAIVFLCVQETAEDAICCVRTRKGRRVLIHERNDLSVRFICYRSDCRAGRPRCRENIASCLDSSIPRKLILFTEDQCAGEIVRRDDHTDVIDKLVGLACELATEVFVQIDQR